MSVAQSAEESAELSGVVNFRDLGGLPAGAGVTRPGVLFRSGALSRLDEGGRRELQRLGIRRIVDLRSDEEVEHEPSHTEGLGIETVRALMFVGSVASFVAQGLTLEEAYAQLLDGSGACIARVVTQLAEGHPTLVHCAIGKDRTGVSVAVTLAAAGVDEDAIVADYAATEAQLPQDRAEQVLEWLTRTHPGDSSLEELYLRSPARAMTATLHHLRQRHGGASAYLRTHGVGDAQLAQLRKRLLLVQ